ncbi:MAG: hypothetical protein AUG51_17440 [Acidobacteria bacterium 13_1_20CM_3_53_8]|nr:MAG: hypothetical protein AUG51_17440 [Acidobacteria bacterium 13_1_20CM_3_53_8]
MARKKEGTSSKKSNSSRNGANGKGTGKTSASKRGRKKRELTAEELTLIAWKKTYENHHQRVKN